VSVLETIARDMERIRAEWQALRPAGGFGLIMIDPPWLLRTNSKTKPGRNARSHYACQPLGWIKALPIRELAAPDAMVWLWTTNPMLELAFDVLAAWRLTYSTKGEWIKTTRSGGLAFGTGFTLRNCNEPYLLSRIGKPAISRSVRSAFLAPIREHSRKPEEAFRVAEALVPNVPRIELFSRTSRPGWISWGDEAGLFDRPDEPELGIGNASR
jgi:N6-adenosine-specific RNA methylase IME4